MKKSRWTIWGTFMLLAIFAGALSGMIATVFTNASLERYLESLNISESFLTISQVKPDPVPGTYEEALAIVQEAGWSGSVLAVPVGGGILDSSDAYGVGVVVTSDGWLLFGKETLAKVANPEAQMEIWVDGELYEITTIVNDSRSDLSLVRVNAFGLDAIAFGDSQNFEGGELLFGIPNLQNLWVSSLLDAAARDDLNSIPAEDYATHWLLQDLPSSAMPLLDTAGELVGFTHSDGSVTPFNQIAPFITSVLRVEEATYAGLGVYTLDLSAALSSIEGLDSDQGGALVVAPAYRASAVLRGSPADVAGIEDADVIIAVNGTLISAKSSLADLLSNYAPEDQATLEVLREEETLTLDVTFILLEDLIY